MKLKYSLYPLFFLLGGILAFPLVSFAQFTTTQGGTGTSSPSGILFGDSTLHLKTLGIGSGLQVSGGILSTTGAAGSPFPFTPSANYNATSTTIGFLQGLFATASSTFNSAVHFAALSDGGLGVNGGLLYSGATTTAGTGLSYSGGAFNVTGLTTAQFASANISQWTNNSGYLTSLAGAASSTLLSDFNTFTHTITGSISGNAGTATALATGRTIAITGDLAYTSPSFDGSGNVTGAGTLATVNSNVGSFTNATLTVNGKGLVTAASSGAAPVTSVSGTANQITSSGGATPTIALATHLIIPAGGYESTLGSTTNATTTGSQYFTGITASRPLYVDSTGKLTSAGSGVSGNCVNWGANNTLGDTGSACGSGGGTGLSTSSPISGGNLLEYSAAGAGSAFGVATSSLGVTGPITFSGTIGSQVGGADGNFGCTTASAGVTGCLSGTDWSTFNNKQSTISATWPVILTGATLSFGGLGTTTNLTQGQIPYVTGVNTFGQVATGTVSAGSSAITVTAGRSVIGGALSIDCAAAGASQNGCLSSANWTTFNNKIDWGAATSTAANQSVYTDAFGKFVSKATSTPTATSPITYSGTFGSFVGGTGGAFACATCVVTSRSLTIAGTANQITSSAGAQDLSADRTWTLSLPTHVIFPAGGFETVLATTTNATTTGSSYFTGVTASRPLYVDSTGLLTSAGTGTSGNCVKWGASNTLSDFGGACGGGGGSAYPFTPSTDGGINTSATSTPIQGTNPGLGLDVSVTSWYGIGGKTLGYASSTNGSTLFGLNAGSNGATTTSSLLANSAFGMDALSLATTSPSNTAVGFGALKGSGTNTFSATGLNTAVGHYALASTTTGSGNTSVGDSAGRLLSGGNSNVFVGSSAGGGGTVSSNGNTGVGTFALRFVSSGANNVSLGLNAGTSVGTGASNTLIGEGVASGVGGATNIANNSALGFSTLNNLNNGGKNNSVFGYQTGADLTTGFDNLILGETQNTGGSNVTTGAGNILIGYNPLATSTDSNRYLNIGNLLFGTLPATSSLTSLQMPTSGVFGVGTTSPFARLSIQLNNLDTTLTVFAIGSSTATATTTLFQITNTGHKIASTTSPALSACGTTPTMKGDDTHGEVTLGTTATGCTITFANAWTVAPICTVTWQGTPLLSQSYVISSTAITLTQTSTSNDKVDYICEGLTGQ